MSSHLIFRVWWWVSQEVVLNIKLDVPCNDHKPVRFETILHLVTSSSSLAVSLVVAAAAAAAVDVAVTLPERAAGDAVPAHGAGAAARPASRLTLRLRCRH